VIRVHEKESPYVSIEFTLSCLGHLRRHAHRGSFRLDRFVDPRANANPTDRDLTQRRVKNGGVLLSVHCDTSDEITRAKELLNRTGAEDISSTGEESVGAGAGSRVS
jgi:hypothetical protein